MSSSVACARPQLRALLTLLLLSLAVITASAQSPPKAPAAKSERGFRTPQQRLKAMHDAALFVPGSIADVDIFKGPKQDKKQFQLHFNDKVICDFATAGKDMGGKTPKFGCKITSVVSPDGTVQTLTPEMDESDPVKVKYGANDNEVYAEVASTRLMWALGFYADDWFPVRVECHNCPADVVNGSGAVSTRMFDPATIVRKFDWHKMTEIGKDDQGWSWMELDSANARPTYERDGLKLLAAFLQHSDNKPPQQRLVCHKVTVDDTANPANATCDKSVMLVQDVGASWGNGGWFTSNDSAKMNIDTWSNQKLWASAGTEASPRQCRAKLRKSLTAHDGLSDPAITEEGRRLDANLLCQLSDQQIVDLFKVARAAAMPKYHNGDGSFKAGTDEASVIQKWVVAFKAKREQLAAARCEWKEKPAELAKIDNPAALATVPNYCAAKPY